MKLSQLRQIIREEIESIKTGDKAGPGARVGNATQKNNSIEAKKFLEILKDKGYDFFIKNNVIIVYYKDSIILDSLTTLPDNIKFKNRGFVSLDSLTTLPENVKFENEGYVYLDSLTSLPEKFKFENKGAVYLPSLTTLPKNVKFENKGFVSLKKSINNKVTNPIYFDKFKFI